MVDQPWIDRQTKDYLALLEQEFEAGTAYKPSKADWFGGRWQGLGRPEEEVTERRNTATAIPVDQLASLGELLTEVPAGVAVHKTLTRILEAKKAMFDRRRGLRLGDR